MTVLLFYPRLLLFQKSVLLLYYLYCLCKSLQRSLLFFYVGFLFRKADAKVKTFKYIFQIFSEVFFIFPFSRHLSCERENKEKIRFTDPDSRKSVSTNAAYFLKAGAKIRTLFHIFQMFSEVFFSFCFFKREISERNKPQAEEIGKSSYAVPVRMSKHRCSRSRKRVQK